MSPPAQPVEVPFCPQQRIDGAERTCGAAALMMVYGSFNSRPRLADVWRSVSHPGPNGLHVPTHRLAADAIASGRTAVCLRANHDPIGSLARLLESGWRVIVNHLLDESQAEGHFSVLIEVGDGEVVLHDPLLGPNRRLPLSRFARLWLPQSPTDEVAGGLLVAVSAKPSPCSTTERCPVCSCQFPLPTELGIGWRGAWSTRWLAAFCPGCDALVTPAPPCAAHSA